MHTDVTQSMRGHTSHGCLLPGRRQVVSKRADSRDCIASASNSARPSIRLKCFGEAPTGSCVKRDAISRIDNCHWSDGEADTKGIIILSRSISEYLSIFVNVVGDPIHYNACVWCRLGGPPAMDGYIDDLNSNNLWKLFCVALNIIRFSVSETGF